MKLLLTSGGITNPSLHAALVELLGKRISECSALCIPTASYGHPMVDPSRPYRFIAGIEQTPLTELGWRSMGVLELTALPSISRERWLQWVEQTDALLCNGGDAAYLAHWMRESGLAELIPAMRDKVWVGISAGSMVMSPRIGPSFVSWPEPEADDTTLGIVDFAIFPHLEHPDLPLNTRDNAQRWAAHLGLPAYAMCDQSAISVVDGEVRVVSEGSWMQFNG